MLLAFPFEISNRRGVRKYTLRIKVCQCYQPHFSARLCLKQTFRESAFGENIVVEIAARSEHRGVVPYQIEFLHADFLILIVTRTNEIVPASDGRSDEVVSVSSFWDRYPTTARSHAARWEDPSRSTADNPDTSFQRSAPYNRGDIVLTQKDRFPQSGRSQSHSC